MAFQQFSGEVPTFSDSSFICSEKCALT